MAITVNGQIYRNLQEQVQYLTDVVNNMHAGEGIVIQNSTISVDPSIYNSIAELKSDITDLQNALIGVSDLIGGDAEWQH